MIYSKEVNKALRFMLKAHEGQVDKNGMPYFLHPLVVACDMSDTVSTVVALLHDVLEDTNYTAEDLLEEGFSKEVVDILQLLVHGKDTPYLDYVSNLSSNVVARRVKMADIRHNSNTARFDGEVPERVLSKIKDCYDPAYEMLAGAEYGMHLATKDDIGAGTATFLVQDEEFRECESSAFVKWLKKEGFKRWKGSRSYAMPVLYVNLNSRTYSYGMPGIRITKTVRDHAITKDEFLQIYNIYKKYDGLSSLKMHPDGD